MSPGERSTVRRALVVLLAAAGVRLASEVRRPDDDPLAGIPDVGATLDSAADRLEIEEARRSRPLAAGERIDANRAPAVELDRLPGVGPALAERWVAHRDSHGGFADAAALSAIAGVGPATVERLRPLLEFSGAASMLRRRERPTRVDLNSADAETLLGLPGIGPVIAERIVEHRRRMPFRSVDDLLDVPGVGPATMRRLRARVTVRRSVRRPWRRARRRVNV
jgi:competence ComEA-like helix-hairpin-helix protein